MIELIGSKIFLDDNYEIREYYTENGNVRVLISDECISSLIFIDKEKRNELGLDYFKYYNLPIDLNSNGVNYLMLGGGAVSYPHHFLNKYKEKNIDIVEINEKCIDYAKKYFYLNELIENNKERINIIIDDAINYISHSDKKYDYILIDLFKGKEPLKEIYNNENIINLKRILTPDGIIIINYIIMNDKSAEELDKITKITSNYKIITNKNNFDKNKKIGNIIIILSNNDIYIPTAYEYIEIGNHI